MPTNSILIKSSIYDSFLQNKVVVMEDDPSIQEAIKEIMIEKLNWQVIIAENKENIVSIAKNNEAAYYIFDVYMGEENSHEGLDALELVKNTEAKLFVSIFSAFPKYENKARKLNANIFVEKTPRLKDNIYQIAFEMLLHRVVIFIEMQKDGIEVSKDIKQETIEKLRKLRNLYQEDRNLYQKIQPNEFYSSLNTVTTKSEDLNIAAYEKLKSTPELFERHEGKYVAFVDGNLVKSDEDEQVLLEWLIHSEEYKEKPRFFAKVKKTSQTIDEPSSLWFDNFKY